eukprot:15475012-Alexandrium_andersonii.AAC.1
MRQRERGIPQGCPWSMCHIALVCSVWVRHTRALAPQAYIRILADDLIAGSGLTAPRRARGRAGS